MNVAGLFRELDRTGKQFIGIVALYLAIAIAAVGMVWFGLRGLH